MSSDNGKCSECGADLSLPGGVDYFETVTKTVETAYQSHLSEGCIIVTERAGEEDEFDGGGVDACRARCGACGMELDPEDWEGVEYAH